MNKLLTTVCCACLAFVGYCVTFSGSTKGSNSVDQNALHAATVPNWEIDGLMPLNNQLSKVNLKDTVYVTIHDTVRVNNIKYVRVPVPEHTTDTLYIPVVSPATVDTTAVKNKNPGDCEIQLEKIPRVVLLTIDGEVVYSSEESASDGLKEP